MVAGGTQTAPGGELSLQAVCNWASAAFGADAVVVVPRALHFATLPPGPRYVPVGRLRALTTEFIGLNARCDTYVGLGDRLPILSRAARSVLVLQNANIYTSHGRDVPWTRRAKYEVQRRWASWSFRRADRVVASTATAADLALASLGADAEKIDVIPIPPIDVVRARTSQSQVLRTIILVGEVRANKRFTWALGEIATWASARGAPIRVVHVGQVPNTAAGQAFRDAAAGLDSIECELRGSLPHVEAMRALADADLLVFPSKLESHGIPLSEAMASGVPVVCSDIPAFRDVGGASPTYFSGADGTLAAALASVEPDGIRSRMAEVGLGLVPLDGAWKLLAEAAPLRR
ncbi:MAG TPA: glycosyltransferase [Acidimicrobiales bacterium]|nr:glycosyltransferase [Acidimicrobiales bacterium]